MFVEYACTQLTAVCLVHPIWLPIVTSIYKPYQSKSGITVNNAVSFDELLILCSV